MNEPTDEERNERDNPLTRAYALEALLVALERARALAVVCGFDAHTLAEIDHLAATVEANKEEEGVGEERGQC